MKRKSELLCCNCQPALAAKEARAADLHQDADADKLGADKAVGHHVHIRKLQDSGQGCCCSEVHAEEDLAALGANGAGWTWSAAWRRSTPPGRLHTRPDGKEQVVSNLDEEELCHPADCGVLLAKSKQVSVTLLAVCSVPHRVLACTQER